MWSGPRNLSTAMMRSFENRSDTVVLDEPFYAHFLDKTNLNHPGRDEVLLSQDCNWNNVVKMITGPIPQNKPIWYQKHMAQHNLDGCDISWIKNLKNCILIRHPKYVIPSYNREYSISNEQIRCHLPSCQYRKLNRQCITMVRRIERGWNLCWTMGSKYFRLLERTQSN